MKLGPATQAFQAACERYGVAGDTREGKGRHYFRLLGKRVITFEFRPYRWVFFRFDRDAFLQQVDTAGVTKAPSPHEPGPSPCGVFTGTQPADDAALLALLDRLVQAVGESRLPFAAKAEPVPEGTAAPGSEEAP